VSATSVPVALLLSDGVLDRTLDGLAVKARGPSGDTDVQNLARWDLKDALIQALRREGLDIDVRRG
jgi:hypothetical protein